MTSVTKWTIIAVWIVLASTVTATLYWIDKRAARYGRDRIAERTLLVASLMGGWPGAILMGRSIRHKTAKVRYRVVFAMAVIANIAMVGSILWVATTK